MTWPGHPGECPSEWLPVLANLGPMSKKRRGKPQERRRTRQLHGVPSEQEERTPAEPRPQELIDGLRQALRTGQPLDLLTGVSSLMNAVDPRSRNPLDPDDQPELSLDELADSFTWVDYAETTAALHVVRALASDELLAARIGRVLKERRQPMPDWIGGLAGVRVDEVVEMTHVLGDGDDYFLGARLPTGEPLTALVYVDHNLGTVVKDSYIIPASIDEVITVFEREVGDPDTSFAEVDPAHARAVVERAVDLGARMVPPLETETWPACRPVVEWLLRELPTGGVPPDRPGWSAEALADLRADFFASTYGAALDRPDERSLLESFGWFSTDWGPGDPLRWSPVNVEMLLVDWIPRKIMAEAAFLAKAPDLLRAFIGYCHDRQGIRKQLTDDTLAAVDRWEPQFRALIEGGPQGPAALVGELLEGGYDLDDFGLSGAMLGSLDDEVGGREALLSLDMVPLPDEGFAWAEVPDDIRERVAEVLERCDRCAEELFDVEFRTACRRFLSRAAAGDPQIFRRKGSPDRAAAAVCWSVARANDIVGSHNSPMTAKDLVGWFGVPGSVSDRATPFLRALGVGPDHRYDMELGSPEYLTSVQRQRLIELRDRYLTIED